MTYAQADYFRIPLLDGQFGVGQVCEMSAGEPTTVYCAISIRRTDDTSEIAPLHLNQIAALSRVSDTLLTTQQWPLAGFDQLPHFRSLFDYDGAKALGFPELPAHDPAVIEAFTNALHGLYPWDAFGDLFEQIKHPDFVRP
jgi:hypothetical protein